MSRCHPAKGGRKTHAPGPPTILTAIAGDGKAIVTWSFPPAGSIPVTGYYVTSTPGNITQLWAPGPLSAVVSGLTNGTSYTFTVTAINSAGHGPPSQPSNSVIPGTALSPTLVSAIASDSRATVSWVASVGAFSYRVTSSPGGLTATSTGTSALVSGLRNGTVYTFTVSATNIYGTGPPSDPSNPVTPKGVPGTPVVTVIPQQSSAVLTWSPPSTGGSPITKYTVTTIPATFTITTTNYTASLTGLTDGASYIFIVTATNALGTGPVVPSSSIVIGGKPGAPTNVVATLSDASANITWTAAPANGAPITKYTVYSFPGTLTAIVTDVRVHARLITDLTATISGLTYGVNYTFTVTATNDYGNGPASLASNSVYPIGLPGASYRIFAIPGDTVANLTWDAAPSNGSPITLYTITSNLPGYTTTSTGLSATISDLINGVACTFTVTATNDVGTGPASPSSASVTPGRVPDPPTVLSSSAGTGSATITWLSPPNNGSTIINYTVTSDPDNIVTQTTKTNVIVQGLTNGVTYTFTVTATNAIGTGAPSLPSEPVIPKGPPGAPTIGAISSGNGFVTLNWFAPNSYGVPISGYNVTLIPGLHTITTSATTTTFTGLENGINYVFSVNATNAYGTGPSSKQSSMIMPTGVPGAPRNPFAISQLSSAKVSWSAPRNNGGFPILYYTVTSSPDNIQATWSSGPLLAIVTGLTNGIAYSFTITATNSYGTGLPSSTSNSTIPGAPGAPTNVSATAGDGRVSLVWTDPSGNGNPIQYYTVYPTPNEGIVGTIINGAEDGGTSSCIVTGLRNGISYVFAVTASNILCTGDFSKPSNSVIPTKELTAPYAPINIVATSGSSQVILSWTDISNGGSPITSHTITGGGVPGIITTNGQNSSCLIKNLTNGATYIFGIRSINAIGTGPPGYSDSVIPSAAPGRPLNVVAIAGDQSSYISWINPHNNGNPILYYTVFSTPNDGVVGTITKGADGGGTSSCTYMGLSAIPYTFTVTATNSVGESQRTVSNSVTPTAPAIPPGPMTNVTAAIGFSNTATISWTVPTGPISSYTITSNPATTIQTAASNATSIIFTGLIYEVPYTFTVVANNTTISGTPGTSNSITLMAPVPGRPTLVSAALSGSTTSAIVSWAAAPGFVTGYTITSSPATTSQTAAGNATSMTFTGLTYGVSYTFTVVARNGSGPGFGSTPSNSITPMPVVPGSPTNVSAAVNNATSVLVTWAAASGYVTGYTITSTPATTSQTAAGNATSKMFTGLTTGVSYTFTVVATNMSGPGTGSAPSNSVTPAYTALTLAFNAGAITLPITGTNITVDFGSGPTASLSGTLASAGQVIINGTVTEFTSDSPWTGVNRLTRVLSWGNNPITNLYRAFVGATSLTSVPTTLPSTVTNTARMFASASAFNGNISGWDMTNVTDTNNMFILATSFTATGLNNWNMTNVTNMYYMFYGTSAAYTNTTPSGKFITNLSGWPSTAAHTQFFSPDGATASGGGTDTTLTDPHSPFNTNTNFTLRFNAGPITLPVTGTNITVDFGSGPTASLSGTLVTAGQVKVYGTITGFGSGSAWTGANLLTSVTTWGTSSITSLNYAFYNATNLTSVPATLPSTVTNLNGTFFGASIFNSTLSTWDVSRVTTMNSMFKNAIAFTAAGLDSWAPFSCTAMNNMFQGTSAAYTRTDATGTFITDLTGWPASPTHTLFFSPDGTDTSLTDPHSPFNDTYSLVLRLNVGTAIGRGGLQFTNLQLIDPTITIYWGDQYNNVYTQGNDKTHYYTPGVYILRIVGRFSALIWNQIPGAAYCGMDLVTHILRWNNDLTTISISESTNPATGVLYPGATNLVYVPPVLPTGIVNLDSMFNGATIFNQNISGWDVSTVTSMSGMFKGAAAFNQNISGWSTSACTNMSSMFQGATSFNQNISGWSITAVKNMSSMFYGATSFTAAGLSTWNPISSTDMHSMFKQTSAAYTRTDASGTFIPNLTGWPYTITNISFFFSPDGTTDTSTTDSHSPYYNRVPLVLTFNAGNITLPVTGTNIRVDFGSGPASSLSGTLAAAGPVIVYGSITAFGSSSGWVGQTRLTNVDSWGSGPLTNLSYAFDGATSLTSVPSTLPSTVINTSYMFRNTASFNGSGLNYWNPTNVTNMNYMFYMFGGYSGDNLIVNLGSWPATATHVFFLSSNGTTDTSETDLKSPFIQTSMILRFAGTPQITLPILGGTVQVDFGNGVTTSSLSGTVSGTVSIFGSFTQFGSSEWQGVSSLLSVDKWPSTLTRLSGAFDGATLLTSVPSTIPASVTSVQYMFRNATLFNQDISGWDVSHILNAESMFSGATSFNRNLSSWNVSNMTTMNSMFQGATSFTATGLDRWTPTSCNTITGMFRGTTAAYTNGFFNINLTNWQTQVVREDYKIYFFSPDGTDTTSSDPNSPFYTQGSTMALTFSGTPTITLPITGGTVYVDFGNGTKGTSLTGTVSGTVLVYGAFTGFGTSGWQGVSSLRSVITWSPTLRNLSNAFNGATSLTSVPVTLPSSVTNTSSMFQGATSFSQNLSGWNVTNVTNMNSMFKGTSASYTNTTASGTFLTNISGWSRTATHVLFFSPNGTTDTSEIDIYSPFTITMILRFTGTPDITLPISGNIITPEIDFGNGVTTSSLSGTVSGPVRIYGTFTQFGSSGWQGVSSLTSVDSWTSRITSFSNAFRDATSLTSVPTTLSSSVINTPYMFQGATSFTQNISGWNVSNITNMDSMFYGATSFTATGLGSWTPTACTVMDRMFKGTSALYTNTSSTGKSVQNLLLWPGTASHYQFFSPNGTIDTSESDLYSPFNPGMTLVFVGIPPIVLPITGTFCVDYGNGVKTTNVSGTVSAPVRIYGPLTSFGSSGWQGSSSIASVSNWPSSITNLSYAFSSSTSSNLTSVPTFLPSSITNTSYMFQGATTFNLNISGWNVSNVTNMTSMFQDATSFNQNLSSWTPTACTAMDNMFKGATSLYTSSLFRYSLISWPGTATHGYFFSPTGSVDTSETDINSPFTPGMTLTFTGTPSIQLPIYDGSPLVDYGNGVKTSSLSGTVSGPVRVYGTFTRFGTQGWQGVTSLVSIANWPTTITTLGGLCYGATSLTSVPATLPSLVTNISYLFQGATSFNQNLSGWDVTNVTNMNSMFYDATSFTATGLGSWTPTACTDMTEMFRGTSAAYTNGYFNTNLIKWPSSATNTRFFYSGSVDTTLTDPNSPFYGPGASMILRFSGGITVTLPITGGAVYVDFGNGTKGTSLTGTASGIVRVYGTFTGFGSSGWQGVASLTSIDSWPMSVTSFANAFNGAMNLTNVPSTLSSSIKNTSSMFQDATSFTQSLTSWNLAGCTAMDNMFRGATALYTNGLCNMNLAIWPATATHDHFFSPNGTIDTTLTDPNSPFYGPSMILNFTGGNIVLPIYSAPFPSVYIDYGNGSLTTSLSGSVNGPVRVYGSFTKFGFDNWTGNFQLLSVEKWPSTLVDTQSAFYGATSLTSVPATIPASVTTVHSLFMGATAFNQDISGWDVSHILNAESMFSGATSFNRNLSSWNVSNMTTMNSMFQGATSFTATGLDRWTPTSCNTITGMFRGTTAAYTLNPSYPQYSIFRLNLNKWQTQAARDDYKVFFLSYDGTNDSTTFDPNSPFYASGSSMTLTFSGTPTVTLPITGGTVYVDFGNGKGTSLTGTVTNTTIQVYGAFTGFGSSGWQGVSSLASIGRWPWTITNFSNAFNGATNLGSVPTLLPMRSNVGYMYPVTNTDSMFRGATSFSQDITVWTTQLGNVTNMNNMFRGASASYTNTSSSGIFVRSMTGWPGIATHVFFFSPDGVTDTTTTDTRSPFYRL